MASVKIIFRSNKPNKQTGECIFYLRVTHNRKQTDFKIGTAKPEYWDFKNNIPSKKHPNYKELLVAIDKKKIEANKLIIELESNNETFTPSFIKEKIVKKNQGAKLSVMDYFKETIQRFKNSNRIGYANIFTSTANSLRTFNKNKDFSFNEVNYSFLVKFEEYHLQRGVKPNAIFVYLRTFRTLLNNAVKDGTVAPEYNPYKDYSLAKFRNIKTEKRTLSKDEIKKIIELELEPDSQLFHAKNYFLFSYYNRGINFIDIANLKWSNIQNSRLFYVRSKTKEPFNIDLLDPVLQILNYYRKINDYTEGTYIFPILNEKHESAISKDYRVDLVLKQVNKNLKKIGEIIGVKTKITTYVARHTFANVLKKGGAKISEISEAMGHDSEHTTQIYLESFENDKLDEITKSILL